MKQVIIGAAIMAFTAAESMYNAQKSEAAIYNTQNFQKQVTNNREKGISIVQFYNGDGKSSRFGNTNVCRASKQEPPGPIRKVCN